MKERVRASMLDRLKRDYHERGLTLVVGAGASFASGIPSWIGLLKQVAATLPGLDGAVVDKLVRAGWSLPAIAGFLRFEFPGSDTDYVRCLREQLYQDFAFFARGGMRLGAPYDGQTLIDCLDQNSTLRSLAAMCVIRDFEREKDGERCYSANPRIHDVITFNIDALFESLIKHKYPSGYPGRDAVYRTIEKPAASSQHGRVNIYHVHGFLRFDDRIGKPDKESVTLVLSEQEYFDFFNTPTSLFTYAFLSKLRENPCVFIGLSMLDDNLRRLLHYSRQERYRSYLLEGAGENKAVRRSKRHYAVLRSDHDVVATRAMTSALDSLGVRAIWIADFEQIPQLLKSVYESDDKHCWEQVY